MQSTRFLDRPATVRHNVFFVVRKNKNIEYWYYIQCLDICTHLHQTFVRARWPGMENPLATARGVRNKTRL